MSLCDRCPAPGACCQVMNLSREGQVLAVWDDDDPSEIIVEWSPDLHTFEPIERIQTWTVPDGDGDQPDPDAGRTYSSWLWRCNALDKRTGRCSRWETRPGLCARYEPASGDGLCVFSQPLENGEESAL